MTEKQRPAHRVVEPIGPTGVSDVPCSTSRLSDLGRTGLQLLEGVLASIARCVGPNQRDAVCTDMTVTALDTRVGAGDEVS